MCSYAQLLARMASITRGRQPPAAIGAAQPEPEPDQDEEQDGTGQDQVRADSTSLVAHSHAKTQKSTHCRKAGAHGDFRPRFLFWPRLKNRAHHLRSNTPIKHVYGSLAMDFQSQSFD